jgi:hypothetical protein
MYRRACDCPNDYARISLSASVHVLGTGCTRGRSHDGAAVRLNNPLMWIAHVILYLCEDVVLVLHRHHMEYLGRRHGLFSTRLHMDAIDTDDTSLWPRGS